MSSTFEPNEINWKRCTHLVYLTAYLNPETYQIMISDHERDITNGRFSKFVALKESNPKLKTMISIGGQTDSNDGTGKYSAMVSNSTNIATFVSSVVSFLQTYGFDGLDIDWEGPLTLSDKVGYSNLTKALRLAFDSSGGFLLSAALTCAVTDISNGNDI